MLYLLKNKKFFYPILIVLFLIGSALMLKSLFYFLFLQVLIPDHTPHLSINDLQKLNSDTVLLLDTRSSEEYSVSHLKGASWVGYEEFTLEQFDDLPSDTTIVLYCSVGYRSDVVGKRLKDAGFTNVYNLWGGIFAWVNKGLPVYDEQSVTQNIHPYSTSWDFWLTRGKKVMQSYKTDIED